MKILDTWRALGMRGTGSNDVLIEDLFVPDASAAVSRKSGEWHSLFHIIATIAIRWSMRPISASGNVRDIAISLAKQKRQTPYATELAGAHGHRLRAAVSASLDDRNGGKNALSADTINEVMIGRSLVAGNATGRRTGIEPAGGAGSLPQQRLERCFRDIQGARFHPLQAGPAGALCGRDGARLAGDAASLNCLPEFSESCTQAADNMAASSPRTLQRIFEKQVELFDRP